MKKYICKTFKKSAQFTPVVNQSFQKHSKKSIDIELLRKSHKNPSYFPSKKYPNKKKIEKTRRDKLMKKLTARISKVTKILIQEHRLNAVLQCSHIQGNKNVPGFLQNLQYLLWEHIDWLQLTIFFFFCKMISVDKNEGKLCNNTTQEKCLTLESPFT